MASFVPVGLLKAKALAKAVSDMIRAHFDAFVVELVGAAASGLTPERLTELLQAGVLDQNKLGGLKIPGMKADLDPFSFVLGAAQVFERAENPIQRQMAAWTLPAWKQHIDTMLEARQWVQPDLPIGGRIVVEAQDHPELRMPEPPVPPAVPPPPPAPPALPPSGADEPPAIPEDVPPAWLAPTEQAAWTQAKTRAGEYARGLGNRAASDLESVVAEVWAGEDIVQEVLPGKRSERLQLVRDLVANAVESHRDPAQLARELADATGDYAHNWSRIAETELQAVFNEGCVIGAIQVYGAEARIARVPESDACEDCKRVFTDGETGRPIVWPVKDLIANGVNVGRKRDQWLASVYPCHPRCKCGTITVPPGPFYVTKHGAIRRDGEKDQSEQT